MAEQDEVKRNDMIRKVQALLEKAASTGFTAEAEALRAKADELMTKFIIEEHELRAAGSVADRETPAVQRITLLEGESPIQHQMSDLALAVANYCGVKIVYHGLAKARWGLAVTAYGFKSELGYFEMLLTSLMIQMANGMEPKPDPTMSTWENFTALKHAGMPWPRVFEVMGMTFNEGRKELMAYRKARANQSEDKFLQPTTAIRSFAEGFVLEVRNRLRALKQERDTNASSSTALVLVDRSIEVITFYAEQTKGLKPMKDPRQNLSSASLARGREHGSRADLGQSSVGNKAPKAVR